MRAGGCSGVLFDAHTLSYFGEGARTDLGVLKELRGLKGDDALRSFLHQSHQQAFFAGRGVVPGTFPGQADQHVCPPAQLVH